MVPLLRYYKLDKEIYRLLATSTSGKVEERIKKAVVNFTEIMKKVSDAGGEYRWNSRYKIFRKFIITGKKGNISKIMQTEAKHEQEQGERQKRLIARALQEDGVWGIHYAYFGYDPKFGQKQKDGKGRREDSEHISIINHGKMLIGDLREASGDEDVETFLYEQTKTLESYLDKGFPITNPEIGDLKYALLWSYKDVVKAYNSVSETPWPANIKEIEYKGEDMPALNPPSSVDSA